MGIDHNIKGIIWDLDNTFYRFTPEFRLSCNQAAAKAVIEMGFDKPYEECLAMAIRSSEEHHFSLYVFITQYGLDYNQLHILFHQYLEPALIDPIDGVIDKIRTLDMPQIILTNASRHWAHKALCEIGATDLFSGHQILAMEDVNMTPKARGTYGYGKALDYLGLQSSDVMFIDDLDRNLEKAKEIGLNTAYIHHGNILKKRPDFMDYQFHNPIDFIDHFGW